MVRAGEVADQLHGRDVGPLQVVESDERRGGRCELAHESRDLLEEAVTPGAGRVLVGASHDLLDRKPHALRERLDERLVREQGVGTGRAVDRAVAIRLNVFRDLGDQTCFANARLRGYRDDGGDSLGSCLAEAREKALELAISTDDRVAGGSGEARGK